MLVTKKKKNPEGYDLHSTIIFTKAVFHLPFLERVIAQGPKISNF